MGMSLSLGLFLGSGGSGAAGVPTGVPVKSVDPAISGIQTVGQTLSVSTGTWSNFPTSYSYQWKRGVTNVGTNSSSYLLVSADAAQSITCVVTASNVPFGAGTGATSNAVTPAAALAISNSPTTTGSAGGAYTTYTPSLTGGHQSGVTNGWSITGSLTGSGLSFSTSTGVLSGATLGSAATYGPYNITYRDADNLTVSTGAFSVVVSATATAVYAPTTSSTPSVSANTQFWWGPSKWISGYTGALYDLQPNGGGAAVPVYPNDLTNNPTTGYPSTDARSQLPDYVRALADLNTAAGGGNPTTALISKAYDQTGNGFHGTQATVANMPLWDYSQMLSGIVPFISDGDGGATDIATGAASPIIRYLENTAISINKQAVTLFMLVNPITNQQVNTLFLAANSAFMSGFNSYVPNDGFMKWSSTLGGTPVVVGLPKLRAMPQVVAVIGGTTNGATNAYVRDAWGSGTATAASAGSVTGVSIFKGTVNASAGQGLCWGFGGHAAALSTADGSTYIAALKSAVAVPTVFTSTGVIIGDSIHAGSYTQYKKNIPQQMTFPAGMEVFNVARGGIDQDTINTTLTAFLASLTASQNGAGTGVLINNGGINDINNGNTGDTVSGRRSTFNAAAKTLGWKVMDTTLTQNGYGGAPTVPQQTLQQNAVNFSTLVPSGAGGQATPHVESDAKVYTFQDATIGGTTLSGSRTVVANGTYFRQGLDQIHPLAAGDLVIAGLYNPVLSALLSASASAATFVGSIGHSKTATATTMSGLALPSSPLTPAIGDVVLIHPNTGGAAGSVGATLSSGGVFQTSQSKTWTAGTGAAQSDRVLWRILTTADFSGGTPTVSVTNLLFGTNGGLTITVYRGNARPITSVSIRVAVQSADAATDLVLTGFEPSKVTQGTVALFMDQDAAGSTGTSAGWTSRLVNNLGTTPYTFTVADMLSGYTNVSTTFAGFTGTKKQGGWLVELV